MSYSVLKYLTNKRVEALMTEYIKVRSQDTNYMKYRYCEVVSIDTIIYSVFPNLERFIFPGGVLFDKELGSSFEKTHLETILHRHPMLQKLTIPHFNWDQRECIQQNSKLDIIVLNLGTSYIHENFRLSLHHHLTLERTCSTTGIRRRIDL
ncbi:hypothetical protein BDA99DRAFT_136510 [Phascolomyces articulosus]|uniref:Uncharacterized protein n=1 Tax=Phascolomyces articulosus TaxID=60185 RepID=A0AAD5JWK6_9FUNG|nr:hypothetical protein BDA99DRAFT_136510 [Phascolomyces articulosus]